MENIKNWCSNKENIKIAFMIVMAIILVVILKIRFGGKSVITADSSSASYEKVIESQTHDSVEGFKKKIPAQASARQKELIFHGPKPPPFLQRNLFAFRQPGINPKRTVEPIEQVNLELTATIIDEQGALAIIGNDVFGMGDMVQGLRVTSIKNDEVVLSKGKRHHVIRIKE